MNAGMNERELVGAYLCGDVTPEERVAVERLLAADAGARAEARELKALRPVLACGERPVPAALLAAVRLRVAELSAARTCVPEGALLLSAGLSGDTEAREKELLTRYMAGHPEARLEAQSLREFSQWLKRGERPVSDGLSGSLTERLSAALPAAGIGRQVSARQVSARLSAEPAVRVYAAPRNVWRGRLAWLGAAAAALVALAFGLAWLLQTRPGGTPTAVKQQQDSPRSGGLQPDGAKEVVAPGPAVGPGELVERREAQTGNGKVVQQEPRRDVAPEPRTPGGKSAARDARDVVVEPQQAPRAPGVMPERVTETQRPVRPRDKEEVAHGNNNGAAAQQPGAQQSVSPPRPPARHGDGTGVAVQVGGAAQNGTVAQAPGADENVSKAAVETLPPDAAEVLLTRDGYVQARTPEGAPVTLTKGQRVASGSQILTDQGRVGLLLPGDGRLWVNGGSSLTLRIRGQETEVTLVRGEIAYRPGGGGSLSVKAENAFATNAKAADVKIEGNALKVFVLDKEAAVGGKGKGAVRVGSGSQATVALNGNEPVRKDAFAGRPDAWKDDLDTVKIITNENDPRGKTRARGRTR